MKNLLKTSAIAALMAIALQSSAQQASGPVSFTGNGNNAFKVGNGDAALASSQPVRPATNLGRGANLLVPVNKVANFTSLSKSRTNRNSEVVANNKGYENDPELGVLYSNAPCSNCYELLDKRTETQKYFIKEGTGTKEFLLQSSNIPVHYKDAQGKWRTISDQLEKKADGIYATTGRPVNIEVHTAEGYLAVVANGGDLAYNRNLELVLKNTDGSETNLGKANWTNYTIGDDGMRVSNAWPGIDMEIGVLINSVKTNFVINKPMPAYAGGKLLIRDHMAPGKGLSFAQASLHSYTGELSFKNGSGDDIYTIQKATAYEKGNTRETLTDLAYGIGTGNTIDIEIPGTMLNKTAGHYPLIIDPLVSGTVSAAFSYATYIETAYCSRTNSMTVPAAANLSDIQMTYTYYGVSGAYWHNAETRYSINGGCTTGWFYCTGSPSGMGGSTCGLSSASFWSGGGSGYPSWGSTSGCVPSYSCNSYTLSFQLDATQDYLNHGSCESSVFATATGFTVVVSGTITLASITPSSAPVCVSATTTLTGAPSGGSWSTSAASVASVSSSGTVFGVSPGSATVTYTRSGYCPATATITSEVPLTVATLTPGAAHICIGSTTTVTPTFGGGTWSSSATSVASADASGNVYGIAPGTAQIRQVRTNTCSSVTDTVTLTVHSLPSPGTLSGPAVLCMPGASTGTLTSSVSGGSWASSDTSVLTIIGSSGYMVAHAYGTVPVSYTVTNTYCSSHADTVITVSPAPAVSPISTQHFLCLGTTIYLSDTAWGGTWAASSSTIASLTSSGSPYATLTGLSAGTINVMYSFTNLCGTATDTATITVQPILSDLNVINTIGGTGGSGISGDGGPALSANMATCDGIARDRAGNVYFSDNDYYGSVLKHVVRKIDPSGTISLFAGNYTTGYSSFGDGGHAVGAGFSHTLGIAVDTVGNVYIADESANAVRKVDVLGYISSYATVIQPNAMCIDKKGNLYVTGYGDCVYKVNTSGSVSVYGGGGSSTADGAAATASSFAWIRGVAVDPDGSVYVSQFNPYWYTAVIRKIDTFGNMSTLVHCYDISLGLTPAVGFGGDGGPSIAASLDYFGPLTCDNAYNLYVGANGRIRKINLRTTIITTVAGNGASSAGAVPEGVPAISSPVTPLNITTDSAGNLYFGDYYYRIRKISNYLQTQMSGSSTVCLGSTSTLTDSIAGFTGTWLNSDPTIATRSATGVITPLALGTTTFTYRVVNDCDSQFATKTITVVNPPTAGTISGPANVCKTGTITLSPSVSGGTWSSSTGFASVSASGVVTGLNVGVDSIAYTVSNPGCSATTKYGITIDDCSWMGIANKVANSTTVNLFPNPNSGDFTVFVSSSNNDNGKVIVRNMLDQQVGEFTVTTNTANKISLNVAPGIYYVTVYVGQDHYVRKVVIER